MLSTNELIAIHEMLTEWFAESEDPISPPGIKDLPLLESAAARPYHTVNGKDAYETVYEKTAALFHSLINNHAFFNGNKRTALVAAQASLAQEGQWLEDVSDEEMFEFTRKAAAHELTSKRVDEVPYIAEWFDDNSRKAIKGDHPLKYSELREHLARFGYTIDPPDAQFLWIYKDGEQVERIIKEGIHGARPYHTHYIAGLRKKLKLTADYGIDSDLFYGTRDPVANASLFIELRLEVMKRLAKT